MASRRAGGRGEETAGVEPGDHTTLGDAWTPPQSLVLAFWKHQGGPGHSVHLFQSKHCRVGLGLCFSNQHPVKSVEVSGPGQGQHRVDAVEGYSTGLGELDAQHIKE